MNTVSLTADDYGNFDVESFGFGIYDNSDLTAP
jgi:hypothetical protein